MRVLIAGAGVIGTVYSAHLGAAGHAVSVLSHPPRTGDITAAGLIARDVLTGSRVETRNLATLHSPALKPVAVRYWARTMRSPGGELFFAAHARHAQPEMRALAVQVTARLGNSPSISRLSELLLVSPPSSP